MPGPRKRLNRVRCGECEQCNNTDCGLCKHCLRKVKFGGDGSGKEACVRRRCTNLQERALSSKARPDDEDNLPLILSGKRRRIQKETFDASSDSPQMLRAGKIIPKAKVLLPPKPNVKEPKKHVIDHLYGRPLPKNPSDVCAGCLGARNEELRFEPILLCDGPGCASEFHLQCCLPETTEVPRDDEYFCIDCSIKGSSAGLDDYFEKVIEDRANYENSHDFVEAQLKAGIKLTKGDASDADETKSDRIPISELDRLSELHHDTLTEPKAPAADPIVQTPDFMVGKPIRIYCPNDNQYHSGRIVDYRKSGHCEKFWGTKDIMTCEYLVRFLAGQDSRKCSCHAWIILEEHSCAIGVSMVWALHKRCWKPAMTWLRTSLELLPVRSQLDERLHQIYTVGGEPFARGHTSWSLVNFLGDEKDYALVSLQQETSRFDAVPKACKFDDNEMLILRALADVELQEQEKIRAWYKLPLHNKAHKSALTISNESALAPINFKNSTEIEGLVPVQLLPAGLDRIWLMEQWGTRTGICKDMLVDIRCQIVKPGPHIIKHYIDQTKDEQFE